MEKRRVLTVRMPKELVDAMREFSEPEESLNDFVVKTVEREVRRRRGAKAMKSTEQLREKWRARHGDTVRSDSTPMIRAMREGRAWND